MVRPTKPDREVVALITIRISLRTKQLLEDLKQKHNFQTLDQTLRYYLESMIIADEIESKKLQLQNSEVDKMISSVSSEVMSKINKDKPIERKPRIVRNTRKAWQSRKEF